MLLATLVAAAAMDHGGDLVSISGGDTAVLLFFAGEVRSCEERSVELIMRVLPLLVKCASGFRTNVDACFVATQF